MTMRQNPHAKLRIPLEWPALRCVRTMCITRKEFYVC